jgi:hypothetical protein
MKNTKRLLMISVVIFIVCSSAYALAPMGPPKSTLDKDRWSLGMEYEHSAMDIETKSNFSSETIDGVPVPPSLKSKFKIEDLKSDMFYVNLGVGLTGKWDIYTRLGLSDAKADFKEVQSSGVNGDNFRGSDASEGFSWGLGTRATFFEGEKLTWGGLVQLNQANPGSVDLKSSTPDFTEGTADLKIWEIQAAFGPTYEMEYCRIYGGPFLHYISGDVELDASYIGTEVVSMKSSKDIKNDTQIGAYIGTQVDITQDSTAFVELQFTGDAWGIGLGASWKF